MCESSCEGAPPDETERPFDCYCDEIAEHERPCAVCRTEATSLSLEEARRIAEGLCPTCGGPVPTPATKGQTDPWLREALRERLHFTAQRCLRCGCSDDYPCEDECAWATEYFCTNCIRPGEWVADVLIGGRPPFLWGPARFYTRTLTRPALHLWAPLACRMKEAPCA